MNTRRRGARGESTAARYLVGKGYQIIAQNFRTAVGEVDIVCERDSTLVFVEVKTWRSMPVEELSSAIGQRKQRRIAAVASEFIALEPRYNDMFKRFDVIFIRPASGSLVHIEGAFDEECQE